MDTDSIKVEVGQYRLMDKGCLKAFFSLIIYPQGQKILDCRYFVQGDKRWFNFPQKEIKFNDGRTTEYIPYISYLNKEYLEQLKIAVLTALQSAQPEETYVQKKHTSYQGQSRNVSTQSSVDPEDLPF